MTVGRLSGGLLCLIIVSEYILCVQGKSFFGKLSEKAVLNKLSTTL